MVKPTLIFASLAVLAGSFFVTSRALATPGVAHCCCSSSGSAVVGVLRAMPNGGQECDTNGHDGHGVESDCLSSQCSDGKGGYVDPSGQCDTTYNSFPPIG